MKDNQNLLVILIILVTLDLGTNVFTYIKINNDFSEQNINRIVKQSIIESQKDLAKELLGSIGLNPEKMQEDSQRAKLSSLKANMHTLQTAVETYAVDWSGLYPETIEVLETEARSKNYWKDFRNPFDDFSGNSVGNYNGYLNTSNRTTFKGIALYEPVTTTASITSYNIRGIDTTGEPIELVLSNR